MTSISTAQRGFTSNRYSNYYGATVFVGLFGELVFIDKDAKVYRGPAPRLGFLPSRSTQVWEPDFGALRELVPIP